MYHSPMESSLQIHLERDKQRSLTDQITTAIGAAIHEGRLAPGARLPSWRDLAAQLGVARGTVRVAYENLRDLQLVDTAGAAGTFVAAASVVAPGASPARHSPPQAPASPAVPRMLQIAVPGQDVFPYKTWSRIMGRAAGGSAPAAGPARPVWRYCPAGGDRPYAVPGARHGLYAGPGVRDPWLRGGL